MTSPFAGLRPPGAPAGLKNRVLERCAQIQSDGDQHLLDRLWENRPARLAWLASVVLLTALLAARTLPGPPAQRSEPSPLAATLAELELSAVGSLAGVADLPRTPPEARDLEIAAWE